MGKRTLKPDTQGWNSFFFFPPPPFLCRLSRFAQVFFPPPFLHKDAFLYGFQALVCKSTFLQAREPLPDLSPPKAAPRPLIRPTRIPRGSAAFCRTSLWAMCRPWPFLQSCVVVPCVFPKALGFSGEFFLTFLFAPFSTWFSVTCSWPCPTIFPICPLF